MKKTLLFLMVMAGMLLLMSPAWAMNLPGGVGGSNHLNNNNLSINQNNIKNSVDNNIRNTNTNLSLNNNSAKAESGSISGAKSNSGSKAKSDANNSWEDKSKTVYEDAPNPHTPAYVTPITNVIQIAPSCSTVRPVNDFEGRWYSRGALEAIVASYDSIWHFFTKKRYVLNMNVTSDIKLDEEPGWILLAKSDDKRFLHRKLARKCQPSGWNIDVDASMEELLFRELLGALEKGCNVLQITKESARPYTDSSVNGIGGLVTQAIPGNNPVLAGLNATVSGSTSRSGGLQGLNGTGLVIPELIYPNLTELNKK